MGVARTKTIKNKHAANKSGISNSKSSKKGPVDGVVKSRKSKATGPKPPPKQVRPQNPIEAMRKRKQKTYTAKDLGIPELNMITPIGVQKPKGKKKGKVFVDDKESMSKIMAIVQDDINGHIESKMIKARQLEEIRAARVQEEEAKAEERKAKLESVKDGLRKKRKREVIPTDDINVKEYASAGTHAKKSKKVSFK